MKFLSKRHIHGLWASLALFTSLPQVMAQIPGLPSITTAGTTHRDSSSRDWAVISLRREDAAVFSGPAFAVYAKTGNVSFAASYSRLSVVQPVSSAALFSPLFDTGAALGDNLAQLESDLAGLARPKSQGGMEVPTGTSLGEKLAALLGARGGNPEVDAVVSSLASTYHSIALAIGTEWAGRITSSPMTFEIREFNPTTSTDLAVIGRVTLATGPQALLPAPGVPTQIVEEDTAGDLNIKLRWGTPDVLRRRSPMGRGFNLYRLPRAMAESSNWHVTAPPPTTIDGLIAAGTAVRVNTAPVYSSADLTEVEAENIGFQPTVFYTADDGNRFRDTNGDGIPDSDVTPWNDGDSFAYIVRGRDIMGREGLPSRAGFGTACRRIPPPVPQDLRVEPKYRAAGDSRPVGLPAGAVQTLQVFWKANVDTARDVTTAYQIFRTYNQRLLQVYGTTEWGNTSPTQPTPPTFGAPGSLPGGLDPDLVFLGTVAQGSGDTNGELSFEDTTMIASPSNFGKTVAYSVRAVRIRPWCEVRAPFSPPAFGTPRNYRGPDQPNGLALINCSQPAVRFVNHQIKAVPPAPDPRRHFIKMVCQRRDERILWVKWTLGANQGAGEPARTLGPIFFEAGSLTAEADFAAENDGDAAKRDLICVVGTAKGREAAYDVLSDTVAYNTASVSQPMFGLLPPQGQTGVYTFEAGELSFDDMDESDPLALTLMSAETQPFSFVRREGPTSIYASTTYLEGIPFLIKADGSRRVGVSVAGEFGAVSFYDRAIDGSPATPTYAGRRILFNPLNANCAHTTAARLPENRPSIPLILNLTPNSKEYRIYRSVDEGAMSLLAQGQGIYTPGGVNRVIREDDGVPNNACSVSYWGQVLDGDGNGSAMALLARIGLRPATMPRPSIVAIEPTGDAITPKLRLKWSCPPEGAERFALCLVPRRGALPPVPVGLQRTSSFARRYSLRTEAGTMQEVVLSARDITSKIGSPSLGVGPVFETDFDVSVGTVYDAWVVAIGCQGDEGPPSPLHVISWRSIAPASTALPWPMRPGVSAGAPYSPLMTLQAMTAPGFGTMMSTHGSMVGVRIGRIAASKNEFALNASGYVFQPQASSRFFGHPDPNSFLFTEETGTAFRKPLPAVLYRRQETNTRFPQVSGDVIQVSPKVEKIAWEPITVESRSAALFKDPHVVPGGMIADDNIVDLYLLDRRPVQRGARYRYWLVRFTPHGEMDHSIDLGTIDIVP